MYADRPRITWSGAKSNIVIDVPAVPPVITHHREVLWGPTRCQSSVAILDELLTYFEERRR